MGRAFEFRRGRKEKRWDKMAKTFTKYGKLISIAVKASGPDPAGNPKLRVIIQNAKSENMPKDRIEAAIAKAAGKDASTFSEVVYEGYGPYGIGILAECATDNPTRTVANIRMYFTRNGGELQKTGSLDFAFERKGVFKLNPEGLNLEDVELDLIDSGLEEVYKDAEGNFVIMTDFKDFGMMQKALEEKGINVLSSDLQRIPTTTKKLTEEQEEEIFDLLDKFEQDEDVSAVYHTME